MIRICSGYVLAAAVLGLCQGADAIIIDHTVVGMVQSATDAELAPAGNYTWYMAQASVGDNITWGVGDLHNASKPSTATGGSTARKAASL